MRLPPRPSHLKNGKRQIEWRGPVSNVPEEWEEEDRMERTRQQCADGLTILRQSVSLIRIVCYHQLHVDLSVFVIQTRATQVRISSSPMSQGGKRGLKDQYMRVSKPR